MKLVQEFTFTKKAVLPKVPPAYLVNGILHRSQTLIFGQTNSGKSMLALSLAVSVASGRSWNGLPVNGSGPVAMVSGDPDGIYENYERLDKVRDDLGDGEVRVFVPERPLAEKTWFELEEITDGCKLMILDNLTQFVPGTLNDDYAVKMVYEKLEAFARNGMSVCVLAHCSDKRNEHGYSSNLPAGSFVIRSVPRWFAYLRRTSGVLNVALSGNSGGRPWEMSLSEPTDTPRFDILDALSPEQLADRKGKGRTRGKLERAEDYRAYKAAHPEMTQKAIAEHFHVSQGTMSRHLNAVA